MAKIEFVTTHPDRNFCAGYPRNPATFYAESDAGEYYEGFVRDYESQDAFEREALSYFNREANNGAWLS